MDQSLKQQDRIDRYLLNEMTLEERKEFEIEMGTNFKLKESIELQRLIIKELKRQSLLSFFQNVEKKKAKSNSLIPAGDEIETSDFIIEEEHPSSEAVLENSISEEYSSAHSYSYYNKLKKYKSRNIAASKVIKESTAHPASKKFYINNKWILAAAAVLIGVIFIIWQPHLSSNQSIYDSYAFAYTPDNLLISNSAINTRGDGVYFENFSSSENALISEAFQLYNEQDYNSAKLIFERVLRPRNRNIELLFYMSLAQLFSNDNEKAIENLIYLVAQNSNEYIFHNDYMYYLALAYIKNNQPRKARKILKVLVKNNEAYSSQARSILKTIRWF